MSSKVNSTFPDSLSPVISRNFHRSSTIGSDFPDTWREETVDVAIISNGTLHIAPVFFTELLVLASIQIDLIDVICAQCIALVANLNHHLGVSPGRVMLLGPFPGVLALTHASAPIPTDAYSIAFVGDCSDTVVPVSLAQRRVLAVGEIKSVQSVLVHN